MPVGNFGASLLENAVASVDVRRQDTAVQEEFGHSQMLLSFSASC